jgi:heme/copper-type cytochrome/quinol oxidase subunit 1
MVYAMASIGILGFIVWSYLVMALLYSDIEVTNSTICFNILMVLSTWMILFSFNLKIPNEKAGKCN